MLYWLSFLSADINIFNIFRYITFRSGGALATSFLIMLLCGPRFIAWLKCKQGEGQPIRQDGPQTHFAKRGTPCMGGLLLLTAVLISALLWAQWTNPYVWVLIFVMLGFGGAGLLDDYKKLTMQSSQGISGKQKLTLQFIISLIACLCLICLDKKMGTTLTIPFLKDVFIDLSYFYVPFVLIVMVGSSNAVNLTDGLDGLVSIPVIMCCLVFAVFAYLVGRIDYSTYLHMHYVSNAGEMAVFCSAVIGATLGFLWFNAHPAQVFMGDTGSLALGGILGTLSVATKQELLLAIAGGVFVMEALSDIIQVGSYKLRKKRVFLMAPIHHHFEKKGWSETTVVIRFWIISILLALIALSSLKIR
ncbi:MAG: phospho-N-acetylmuramoyl-pentapeptide-transferase [Alphaproteobacteria bacterium]|nr:phospho-N-acetylmuramoyl-pentapeptide-transferase [Alphaproteobacteria bacterium]MBQ3117783.1 phospho-N-acetylmuramoyl-pentapeptide-transferase [Alphaproteobacteria bacterium]MBQ6853870.1 phospho-N-acetylmuramoyl-pentapeptide-transferase [Alphaproteobacteria bacterium]MBR3913903.1 phospho-N-acetylmuramoyl-pentapeptide-transferase [Alphaproteobacteria bacterium]